MIIDNNKQLLTKIKAIIVEKEVKKKDLSLKLNISQSALTSRLNQKNISINSLLEICDALDIKLDINFIESNDIK